MRDHYWTSLAAPLEELLRWNNELVTTLIDVLGRIEIRAARDKCEGFLRSINFSAKICKTLIPLLILEIYNYFLSKVSPPNEVPPNEARHETIIPGAILLYKLDHCVIISVVASMQSRVASTGLERKFATKNCKMFLVLIPSYLKRILSMSPLKNQSVSVLISFSA